MNPPLNLFPICAGAVRYVPLSVAGCAKPTNIEGFVVIVVMPVYDTTSATLLTSLRLCQLTIPNSVTNGACCFGFLRICVFVS